MATERERTKPGRDRDERPADQFDEALREAVEREEDETSSEDADASAFLERFPVAARSPQRPKDE